MNRTTLWSSLIIVAVALAIGASLTFSGVGDAATVATTAPPEGTGDSNDLPSDIAVVTAPWATDWSRTTIDLSELKVGINVVDPRDRIVPIDNPRYEDVASASEWLIPREIGIQVQFDGGARFFPLRILTSHEVVNDVIDGIPVAITYCPLCNTAVAFDRRVDGEVLRFGLAGGDQRRATGANR